MNCWDGVLILLAFGLSVVILRELWIGPPDDDW